MEFNQINNNVGNVTNVGVKPKMNCPFCGSENVDVPMVDIGVGEIQCGPALCGDCLSGQNSEGVWTKNEESEKPVTTAQHG